MNYAWNFAGRKHLSRCWEFAAERTMFKLCALMTVIDICSMSLCCNNQECFPEKVSYLLAMSFYAICPRRSIQYNLIAISRSVQYNLILAMSFYTICPNRNFMFSPIQSNADIILCEHGLCYLLAMSIYAICPNRHFT